ncbi:hypothetical protein TYRP_009757 [Tyrophagus putrescentiae]|nr:hypothetical protein TYRP_009757 [Tyrophagus putrescentiae]
MAPAKKTKNQPYRTTSRYKKRKKKKVQAKKPVVPAAVPENPVVLEDPTVSDEPMVPENPITWERMIGFSLFQAEKTIQHVLPLPWTRHKQVLLFVNNGIRLLRMDRPDGMTLSNVDLRQMVELPPDMVVNVEVNLFVNWVAVTVDEDRPGLYCLAEVSAGQLVNRELGVYRMDWPTQAWVRIPLPETPTKRLVRGDFIIQHGPYLSIGVVERRLHPEEGSYIRRANQFEQVVALTHVIRINLHDFDFNIYIIPPQLDQWTLDHQVALKYSYIGSKVFIMNALATTVDGYMTVVKNQLWVLDLNYLRMNKLNDGPVGTVKTFEPESPKAAMEREKRKAEMAMATAMAAGDIRLATAFFAAVARGDNVIGEPSVVHTPAPANGNNTNSGAVNSAPGPSSKKGVSVSESESQKDGNTVHPHLKATIRIVSEVPASKLLMRNFIIAIGSERRDLWALNTSPLTSPTDQINMYRVPLWGVSRLSTLAFESVLFRAPIKSLVVQSMTCSHNHLFDRVFPKQERTLEHISRFFKAAGVPVERLLPVSLPPILRVMPRTMANSYGVGGDAARMAASLGRMRAAGSLFTIPPDMAGSAAARLQPFMGGSQGYQLGQLQLPARSTEGSAAAAATAAPTPRIFPYPPPAHPQQPQQPHLAVTLPAIPIPFNPRIEHGQYRPAVSASPYSSYLPQQQIFYITRENAYTDSALETGEGRGGDAVWGWGRQLPPLRPPPVSAPLFADALRHLPLPDAPRCGSRSGGGGCACARRSRLRPPTHRRSGRSSRHRPVPRDMFLRRPSSPPTWRRTEELALERHPATSGNAASTAASVPTVNLTDTEANEGSAQQRPPAPHFATLPNYAHYNHFSAAAAAPSPLQSAFSAAQLQRGNFTGSSRAVAELQSPPVSRQVRALVYGRPAEVLAEVHTPVHYIPIRVEGLTPEHFRIRQAEEIVLPRPFPHVLSPAFDGDLGVPVIHVRVHRQNDDHHYGHLYGMSVPIG